jgi:uncharacterized phiE125 gp8 family phage protein
MSSVLLTAPAAEPLSLAEAKAFLRVETADDDALIAALIAAARLHVETRAGLALIAQEWRMVFDRWQDNGRITVRPAPLVVLIAARVIDFDGEARALDTQAFVPDRARSMLAFMPWTLPVPTRLVAGIELDVKVGFGETASDVPEPLRQAIRLLTAHWYENRGAVASEAGAPLPRDAAALIATYRVPTL